MRCLVISLMIVMIALAGSVSASESVEPEVDSITLGEFAQLLIDIALDYRQSTPDPQTALEKLQVRGLVSSDWNFDDLMTHGDLRDFLHPVGIDYQTAKPDAPVSRKFVEALLWRETGKLRDYSAKRLGHGISANHILDAGVDRAVSPSDFD